MNERYSSKKALTASYLEPSGRGHKEEEEEDPVSGRGRVSHDLFMSLLLGKYIIN